MPTIETNARADAWVEVVKKKVEALRFGSVQIIVHEGRVTQVESTEKTRFVGTDSAASTGLRPH